MKKKITRIVFIVLFIILLLAGTVFCACQFGMFLNAHDKILLAAANTLRTSPFTTVVRQSELLRSDTMTAKMDWSAGMMSGSADIVIGEKENGVTADIGALGVSMQVQGRVDGDMVEFAIPMLDDKVYTHQVDQLQQSDFFYELLGNRRAASLDAFLFALSGLKWKKPQAMGVFANIKTDLPKLRRQWKQCPIERIEDRIYSINGEDEACRGYQADLSSLAMLEDMELGISLQYIECYLKNNHLVAVRFAKGEQVVELVFPDTENESTVIVEIPQKYSITVDISGQEWPYDWKFKAQTKDNTKVVCKGTLQQGEISAEIVTAVIRKKQSKLSGEFVMTPGGEVPQLDGERQELDAMSDMKKKLLVNMMRLLFP